MLSLIENKKCYWPLGKSNHFWIAVSFDEAEKYPPDLHAFERQSHGR